MRDGRPGAKILPEDLVETIIAMMPFPSIFKCRCLSKSWLARLSSVQGQDDEGEKRRATLFQKLVSERSNNWKIFCPIFAKDKQDWIAYDRVCDKWQRLPSLSLLPEGILGERAVQMDGALLHSFRPSVPQSKRYVGNVLTGTWGERSVQMDGALLHSFRPSVPQSKRYVANVLTGTWKQLSACPDVNLTILSETLVNCSSLEMYKVILFCERKRKEFYVQTYDSRLDAWNIKELSVSRPSAFYYNNNVVCLNGVLYFWQYIGRRPTLWALKVEEGTLQEFDVPINRYVDRVGVRQYSIAVMAWNAGLLLVLEEDYPTFPKPLHVLKIDVQSGQSLECAKGFPYRFHAHYIEPKPVFDGNRIFFGERESCQMQLDEDRLMETYNFDKDEWGTFRIPTQKSAAEWEYKGLGCVFQPGLSPFAAV